MTSSRARAPAKGGRTKPVSRACEGGRTKPSLPEVEAVYWRPRVNERRLRSAGRLWSLTTAAHTIPFLTAGGLLLAIEPLSFPVAIMGAAHAWAIPELYAKRGANVLRARPPRGEAAEGRAAGLLGDLVSHEPRALHARTGLVPERGRFGVWLVGEAGAVLVVAGGRRVHCFCVRAEDPDLPAGDRIAHLLLALREDEAGFATVANLAFSGAPWRVRRRLPAEIRPALDEAVALARRSSPRP